jgi:hypothetical protein
MFIKTAMAHKVSVWIYEGSLRVEREAVTLSEYEIELESDRKHVQAVSNPQTHQTPFRSPQLALFDLGPDGWILYWKKDDQAKAPRRHFDSSIIQLPLFDLPPIEKAVGAEDQTSTRRASRHLSPVNPLGDQEVPEE